MATVITLTIVWTVVGMNKYTLDTNEKFLDIVADLVIQLKIAENELKTEEAKKIQIELLTYLKGQI